LSHLKNVSSAAAICEAPDGAGRRSHMSDGKWVTARTANTSGARAIVPLEDEEARCLHPELSKYSLAVFGAWRVLRVRSSHGLAGDD